MIKLFLEEEYLNKIRSILNKEIPSSVVWAYGSRVKGTAHEGSDLDIVIRSSNHKNKNLGALKRIFQESEIPFLIDIAIWEELPDYLKEEIERNHFILKN